MYGLYSRAASNLEQLMMARIRYSEFEIPHIQITNTINHSSKAQFLVNFLENQQVYQVKDKK